MNIIPPNEYRAALYMRLSKDEITKEESNSITNQRNILTEFANKSGFRIVGEYIDDGCSGTNYDRPGFQQMLSDIPERKINMVIVKDQSRLGRNRLATDTFMEETFPKMGIRFIAVGNDYDGIKIDSPAADMAPIVNLFKNISCSGMKIRESSQT